MRNLLRLLAVTALLAAVACSSAPASEDQQPADSPASAPAGPPARTVLVETTSGNGSGVIIDARHILTDAHVVWPFLEAAVRLPDDTPTTATVIAFDRYVDLALLELPESAASGLTPITVATEVELGQTVTHLGYSRTADGSLSMTRPA